MNRCESNGQYDLFSKKEVARYERERKKLEKNLSGIKEMAGLPDALFVIDTKLETIAIKEAAKLGIPIIGVADTNCDPDEIDYIIPGNDDALRAIRLITDTIAQAYLEGKSVFEAQQKEQAEQMEKQRQIQAQQAAAAREAAAKAAAAMLARALKARSPRESPAEGAALRLLKPMHVRRPRCGRHSSEKPSPGNPSRQRRQNLPPLSVLRTNLRVFPQPRGSSRTNKSSPVKAGISLHIFIPPYNSPGPGFAG